MTKYRLIALVVLATAVLLTTGALAFQPPGPSRRATSFDRAHASTWGDVFANPRPIRVETLDTGIVTDHRSACSLISSATNDEATC
jgi:hypothetical protein